MASRLLSAAGFRRLFSAQVVSSFGDWLATFALMALALDISGSTTAVGGILVLRMAPAVVTGPLLRFAGGRWSRKRLLLSLDLIRAALVAVIPLIRSLWWVYPWTLTMEVATLVAIAARDTSIRDLVDDSKLETANSAITAASYGSIPLGAGVFTGISWLAGQIGLDGLIDRFHVALWLDAATFLVSFAFISRITDLPARPDLGGDDRSVRFRQALRVPLIRGTLPPLFVASMGIGTMFSVGIGFVRDSLGAGDAQFGLLVLVFGVGAGLGLGLRSWLEGGEVLGVRVGVAAMGLVLAAMSFVRTMGLTFIAAGAFGVAGAYAIVSGLTRLQADLDPARRFLGLGAFHIGVRVALSIGALAAGVAVDLLGEGGGRDPIRIVMLVAGGLVTLAAILMSRVGEGAPSDAG